MNTKIFIPFIFSLFLIACQKYSETSNEKPNIVFIVADDASWLHFGCYGSHEVNSPNIDKLAKEGVVFDNAFASTSSCTPSRASILTGRNGFELEEGATLWGYLPAKFDTYTEILAKNGYKVGASGKGWDPGFLIDRDVNPAGLVYNEVKQNLYKGLIRDVQFSDINYAGNFESFLKTVDNSEPFCFWIGTFEPHRGYTSSLASLRGKNGDLVSVPGFLPNSKDVREDINEYYAEIELVDDQVGKVMEVLKKQDKLENTLIFVTSDNGMPFPRAKATLYDFGTHMPLIAWWGNKIKSGRRVKEMVSLTDIAPTILEAAGLNIPKDMSGKSLLSEITANDSGLIDKKRNRVFLYRERHGFYPNSNGLSYPSRAIRTDKYLLIWNLFPKRTPNDVDGGPTKSFMDANKTEFADIYNLSFGKRPEHELYNIQTDTFQLNNLAYKEEFRELFENLKLELLDYLISRKDPRLSDKEGAFVYNPYFGFAFQNGLLKWTPEEQGQNLTFEERRQILKKAYEMMNETVFFNEMIRRQNGKL